MTNSFNISALLSSINLFKIPIRLKMNQKSFFSPKIGEIFSLVIFGYLLTTLISSDAFTKLHPSIIQNEAQTPSYPWFNFTEENFFIGGFVTDHFGAPVQYDSTIYDIYAVYGEYTTNLTTGAFEQSKLVNLKMVPCIQYSFYTKGMSTYAKQYPMAYCLPIINFTIGGSFSEPKTNVLTISLQMCKNQTSNNTCKTQSEINNFFIEKKFAFALKETVLSTNDYENPFASQYITSFLNLDYRVKKIQKMNVQGLQVIDDDHLVLSNDHIKENWQFANNENDFDLNSEVELCEIDFYSINKVLKVNRSYMKLQQALSNLGGIINVMISVGFIFLQLIPFDNLGLTLSNHLYSFRSAKKGKKTFFDTQTQVQRTEKFDLLTINDPESTILPEKITKKIEINEATKKQTFGIKACQGDEPIHEEKSYDSEKNIKETFQKKYEFQCTQKENEMKSEPPKHSSRKSFIKGKSVLHDSEKNEKKKFIENFRNYSKIKNKKNNLNFHVCEIFQPNGLKKLKDKYKALKIAETKISEDLDIMNIMEKFQELDKIKMILFNQEQLTLFNLIAKPEIIIEDDHISNTSKEEDPGILISESLKKMEAKSDQSLFNFVVYYNKIKNKVNNDDLDSRLLKLVDEDMKKYFNIY